MGVAASALLVGTGAAYAATSPAPGTSASPPAVRPSAATSTPTAPGISTAPSLPPRTAAWAAAVQASPFVRSTPGPSPAERDATVVRALPRAYRLTLRAQYQLTSYYCVPAATAMSLSTFGLKISQATLAQKMRTTTRGTGGDSAASVMDAYIHPKKYDDRIVGDVVGRPELLMQRVSYDVGSLRRAPVIQVWMERLPWNLGTLRGRWVGHAIVAYGYDQRAGTITVFDPWKPTGGTHTLSARSLSMTLQSGAGMHYISRT